MLSQVSQFTGYGRKHRSPLPHFAVSAALSKHQNPYQTRNYSEMTTPTPLTTRTDPLYQKDGSKHTHTAPITSIAPLSSLPQEHQSLFEPPTKTDKEAFILTTPSTIFHTQGGGQPSDTGSITAGEVRFEVHQVRKVDPAILHMGIFASSKIFAGDGAEEGAQSIDVDKRVLHSRIHTAGHVLGLAAAALRAEGVMDSSIVDGKASHYPGAAFVEFIGLIPSELKAQLQAKTDELVNADLPVEILFWDEEKARKECTGVLDSFKQDEDGVRVVRIGEAGSYPCGGTHVQSTKGCGRVVVRNVKRQKGVTKVSYEVQDV